MTMPKIIMSGIGGSFLYISPNSFGMLHSKVAQEAAAVFPEFDVGDLDEILHHGARRLAPQRRRPHYGQADGLSDPGNELLPRVVIARAGAETNEVFQ